MVPPHFSRTKVTLGLVFDIQYSANIYNISATSNSDRSPRQIILSCVESCSQCSYKGSDFYRQYKKASDCFLLPSLPGVSDSCRCKILGDDRFVVSLRVRSCVTNVLCARLHYSGIRDNTCLTPRRSRVAYRRINTTTNRNPIR